MGKSGNGLVWIGPAMQITSVAFCLLCLVTRDQIPMAINILYFCSILLATLSLAWAKQEVARNRSTQAEYSKFVSPGTH